MSYPDVDAPAREALLERARAEAATLEALMRSILKLFADGRLVYRRREQPLPAIEAKVARLRRLRPHGLGTLVPVKRCVNVACTSAAASWCPACGDCSCPLNADGETLSVNGGPGKDHPGCPLHSPLSEHAVPRASDRCTACGWRGSWDGAVCPECGKATVTA